MKRIAILFVAIALLAAAMPTEAEACGGRVIGKARSGGRAVVRFVGRIVTPFR